jgi:hypothetical protein
MTGALAYLIIGFTCGIIVRRKSIPFVGKKDFRWSIGIYTGDSPFSLSPPKGIKNPVLTARDVSDVAADFVADPFMIRRGQKWHMFFEVMNTHTARGEIGLAESDNGLDWKYRRIILNEPFHLSYPYVFAWENEYYMIPETYRTNSVRLYKAVDFPTQWMFLGTLLKGYPFVDTSVFQHNGKWWMFTAVTNSILHLYAADKLSGPWVLHPDSPVVMGDLRKARPGGRVVVLNDKVFRYAQDDHVCYGNQVRAFEITGLSTTGYKEREVKEEPIITASGSGWNAKGMHNIDVQQVSSDQWLACVDGYREGLVFGLSY